MDMDIFINPASDAKNITNTHMNVISSSMDCPQAFFWEHIF